MCYIAYTRFSLYITSTVTTQHCNNCYNKNINTDKTTKGLFILKKKKNTKKQ